MANKHYLVLLMVLMVILPGFAKVHGEDFGKVMPLGDSITFGANTPGGYRDPLYQLLISKGHTLQYVGTLNTNSTALLNADGRQYHQGMSGWVIATGGGRTGLYEYITDWMAATDPDVILLMIGTNDCGIGYDIPNVHVRLDALVERIFTNKPTVRLLLATVVPSSDPPTEANVVILNAQIPAIVTNHQALGRNIQLVPMYDALNASTDLVDTLHPDRGGYHKMATTWYESMTGDIPSDIILSGQSVSGPDGSSVEETYAVDIVTNDLISDSSTTLLSWSRGEVNFEHNTLNDGGYGGTLVSETFNEGYLPCTYTYELDTSIAPYGYNITQIRTYAGYPSDGPCIANQKYAMLVDYVDGNPDFVWVENFEYSPFSSSNSDPVAATKVTLTSKTGTIVSGISRIRFVLLDHGHARGQYDGSIYQEIDVLGVPIAPPDPALVAHWQFNENGGSVAADSSGIGYDGQLMNMDPASWTAGKQCAGLSFDGTDDYVVISGYKGILGVASRTCTAWIKTTATSQSTILSWGTRDFGQHWTFRTEADGTLGVGIWGGVIHTTATVNDGRWHNVAAVLINDGSPSVNEILLFIDGVLQIDATANTTQSINTAGFQDVMIGMYESATGPALLFDGLIDDVRIYNYALSYGEIQGIYQQYALIADTEPDGDIDLNDFAFLAGYWLISDPSPADLTCDDTVDLDDLMILVDEWLGSI
ncbi:MAG: hypothetical protein JW860_01740 [Sedimentisphaerales bacterium]|nr:hypothetical protein [Sedimentisphaerales bacterium]